jgi:hypothetical protein
MSSVSILVCRDAQRIAPCRMVVGVNLSNGAPVNLSKIVRCSEYGTEGTTYALRTDGA